MAHDIAIVVEISVIVDGNRKSTAYYKKNIPTNLSVRETFNSVSIAMITSAHRCVSPALVEFRRKFGETLENL